MKNFQLSSFLFLLFVAFSCLGQEITVSDNLLDVFNKLKTEKYRRAVICNAFTTRFDIFEEASKQGTPVHVVCKKSSNEYYAKVKDKSKVVGYHADLHDKLVLTHSNKRVWSVDVGSANFSKQHFKNTEVVLHIPDATKMPGLTAHMAAILERATLFEPVTNKYNPRKPALPLGQKTFSDKRRGSLASEGVVSCFDFEKGSSLVSWMADRIKVNEKREYCISSMNLDHPVFIGRIKQAVCNGSTFDIIVDKDVKHLKKSHPIADLAQFSKQYPDKLSLVWKKGHDTEYGTHHAKLFVRSPNNKGEEGLTIVPTANFTKGGAREHNCAVVLPHASAHPNTIQNLDKKFKEWKKQAEVISSVPKQTRYVSFLSMCFDFLQRNKSKSSKKDTIFTGLDTHQSKDVDCITDTVINEIFTQGACTYCLMTASCNKKDYIDHIEKAVKKGCVFKILLPAEWMRKKDGFPGKFASLAKDNPNSIEIKGTKKPIKNTLLIREPNAGSQCKPHASVITASLTYQADRYVKEGVSFGEGDDIKKISKSFKVLWEKGIAI